jgi:pilus assembly protein TadC
MSASIPAVLLGLAVALALPAPPVVFARGPARSPDPDLGWLARHRLALCLLAGVGAGLFVGGDAGVVAAVLAAGGCWVVIARAEPAEERRRRAAAARDLPQLVRLLAIALEAGAAPVEALAIVVETVPDEIGARLDGVLARLRLGVDPSDAWALLAADPALAPLGRTLGRAHDTGASVAVVVRRLADELAAHQRASVEERARAVGVRAAVPLGLCLMPSFLLTGVVPLVGGLVSGLTW